MSKPPASAGFAGALDCAVISVCAPVHAKQQTSHYPSGTLVCNVLACADRLHVLGLDQISSGIAIDFIISMGF